MIFSEEARVIEVWYSFDLMWSWNCFKRVLLKRQFLRWFLRRWMSFLFRDERFWAVCCLKNGIIREEIFFNCVRMYWRNMISFILCKWMEELIRERGNIAGKVLQEASILKKPGTDTFFSSVYMIRIHSYTQRM